MTTATGDHRAWRPAGPASGGAPPDRLVMPAGRFSEDVTTLRLVTLDDCTERYVGWLKDPMVNRFLETRRRPQTLQTVRDYVTSMLDSRYSYLFAIIDDADDRHIGNLKIGPVDWYHLHADVSYFIGERDCWGRGHATRAIRIAQRIAFGRLGLHRVQAGCYASNVASARALRKAGFVDEHVSRRQLWGPDGWEDHLWFGSIAEEWDGGPAPNGTERPSTRS